MKGKVVMVTGAASGMGLATARLLAQRGARLAVCDYDGNGIGKLGAELGREVALPLQVDISRTEQVRDAVKATVEEFDRIDGLITFAGIFNDAKLEEVTDEIWHRVLDVNLKGTFFTAQAVAEVMKAQGSGHIVLVASAAARHGSVVSGPAYTASKGGVIAMTRSLALLLGSAGITVNCINPGLTKTGMSRTWSPEVLANAVRRTPLGRLGEPDDIAGVAYFLLSDLSKYMTGEVLEVNGGFYFD